MLTHARIFHNHLPPGIIFILYIHSPIMFLHFFGLPSRLLPILTHSLSSSISVSAWWVSSSGPPLSLSLLPSVLYLFAFAIIFVLGIKWSYFSAQPHTCRLCHVPAEEFTSHLLPHSLLSSTVPSFAHLLLLALSLVLLVASQSWMRVSVFHLNPEWLAVLFTGLHSSATTCEQDPVWLLSCFMLAADLWLWSVKQHLPQTPNWHFQISSVMTKKCKYT